MTSLCPRVSTPSMLLTKSPPGDERVANWSPGFYGWMLTQDLDHTHYAYNIGLEFDGAVRQEGIAMLRGLLSEVGEYERESADRLLLRLVSVVANDHLASGMSIFELFLDDSGKSPGPRLGVLPWWSIRRRWGRTYQVGFKSSKLVRRILPVSALREFTLPGRLGRDLHDTMKRLRALDVTQSNPGLQARADSSPPRGYDLKVHQRTSNLMAARVTKSIGWDGRGSFMDRGTDSYRMYRELKFRRTWIAIAQATIETLNTICGNPAFYDNSPIRVNVTGLPTVEDIDRSLAAVLDGSESLDDIRRRVLHPPRS